MSHGCWNRRQPTSLMLSSGGMLKRPRSDYDAPPTELHPAYEMYNYSARDDNRGGHLSVKDTKTVGSAYDRYLQSAQFSSFTSGEASTFGRLPVDAISRSGRDAVPLPPEASNILYVEGLPPDSTTREVAHIFRPFVGYKEVRLVSKESGHVSGLGYKMDEYDPDSNYLRLQFSRYPGPRSGSGTYGRR